MNLEQNNSLSSTKDKTILYLLGINKKWVRNTENEWSEFIEKDAQTTSIEFTFEEPEVIKKKKWWQFWIKTI